MFSYAEDFSNGLALVAAENEAGKIRLGFINAHGDFVIKPTFVKARSFTEGRAAVRNATGWTFIDHTGQILFNPTDGSSLIAPQK